MANPVSISISTLLGYLKHYQIIDPEVLTRFVRKNAIDEASTEDAGPLANLLVADGLLTRFQVQLLLDGKSKSLLIAQKYRLMDRLGSGGMGLVYLCEHVRMKRLVALKVLPSAAVKEPGAIERFHREAQAVAALRHPNIVQAFDIDSDHKLHFLVMEYIDGVNLGVLVERSGKLNPIRAVQYIAQACAGLQHACERGMVHRDIKPGNLLLDREGLIRILDMGLARFFHAGNDNITSRYDSNSVLGTADYIAPEQALNSQDVDIRADIYSLGCTLYFLLTGQAPFFDAGITQKLLLHQMREPKPVTEYRTDVDSGILEVLKRMTTKTREDRFQTPAEVIEALAPWLQNEIPLPTDQEIPLSSYQGGSSAPTTRLTRPASGNSLISVRPSPNAGSTSSVRSIPATSATPATAPKKSGAGKLVPALGLGLLIAGGLALLRPWESTPESTVAQRNPEAENPAVIKSEPIPPPSKKLPPEPVAKQIPPENAVASLKDGFGIVRLDPDIPRPEIRNNDLRTRPSDLLFFRGKELRSPNDFGRIALRPYLTGGEGRSAGSTPIIPFALATTGSGRIPNTFLTVDSEGRLRPLDWKAKNDLTQTGDLSNVAPNQNIRTENDVTLPPGLTRLNALLLEGSLLAATTGSTLQPASGMILVVPPDQSSSLAIGGENSLILDFGGKTGTIVVSSSQDFRTVKPPRFIDLNAKILGTGSNPLILAGLMGNAFRLHSTENGSPMLVVQGLEVVPGQRTFRVLFSDDRQLGPAKAPLLLIDGHIEYDQPEKLETPRDVVIGQGNSGMGGIGVGNVRSHIRWNGKISGSGLVKTGAGMLMLLNKDNSFESLHIRGGRVQIQSHLGTPAGTGPVFVSKHAQLDGTGTITGSVTVESGGSIHPGSSYGRPIYFRGPVILQEGSVIDTQLYRVTNSPDDGTSMVFSGNQEISLANATLRFNPVAPYVPEADHRCFILRNQTGRAFAGTFVNAPEGTTIASTDQVWTAKISYQGDAAKKSLDGGNDVVLYDFQKRK